MKKTYFLICLVLIFALMMPISTVSADDNGVDDLRGRWDVDLYGENLPPSVILYINDIQENPYSPSMYLAGGCMRSPGSDVFMPLSLAAIADPANGTYNVTIYSTVVEPEGWVYVIRLAGLVTVNGKGVPDDMAGGTVTTEFTTNGEWNGIHHDRRHTKCPSIGGFDFGVQADVYAHKDLAYPTPKHYTLYEAHTVVVSSGMLVTEPDGSTMIVQEYTDIFSPDVDFIGRFRYLTHFDGAPVSGEEYNFVLLDVFGNPIPGTESTDIWTGCEQDAPTNLEVNYELGSDVTLSWTAIDDVPRQFVPDPLDPENGIGFYQIGVSPFQWDGERNYGANGIQSPWHVIPWNTFIPGQSGVPDGWDYGWSLSELEDGLYQVQSEAFGQPKPENGGYGHECSVYNSAEQLLMSKQGNELSFDQFSTISGQVVEQETGEPLEGILVAACVVDAYCNAERTDENGLYEIVVPPGTYRVGAHHESDYVSEYYNEKAFWDEADDVLVDPGEDEAGINFTLEPVGSISGAVEANGNPVVGVWVDACHESVPVDEWGQSPLCYGAPTDENGYYEIHRILPGNYRMVIWGDEQYVAEFYDNVPTYDEATLVPVVAGQVAENRDFDLTVAGSISGTVTADENSVVGIWVDACHESVPENEWGQSPLCYGAPTDENGYYEIHGIMPGNYRVVTWGTEELGHEFYNDVQNYDEAILVPVVAGQTAGNIDFSLEIYVEPSPQFLNVQPDHMWAHSGGWAEGAEVILSIGSFSTSQFASADGNVWFDDLSGSGIAPGMNVNVTDGTTSKDLLVVNASFDGVDDVENTAWGTAPADAWLGVAVVDVNGNEDGFHWIDGIQADEFGDWFFDFDDYGQDFNAVIDAWVHVFDGDGDSTLAHLEVSGP